MAVHFLIVSKSKDETFFLGTFDRFMVLDHPQNNKIYVINRQSWRKSRINEQIQRTCQANEASGNVICQ